MAVQAVRNILQLAVGVTSLVGTRVSPVQIAQAVQRPAVVLTRISVIPQNSLADPPTLDFNRVQLDVYADTYIQARQVADACRAALEAADVTMMAEEDSFEPDVPEYRVTQDYLVWT